MQPINALLLHDLIHQHFFGNLEIFWGLGNKKSGLAF